MSIFEKQCDTCDYAINCSDEDPCVRCVLGLGNLSSPLLWKPSGWVVRWLKSFDTSSATKCFEAVNLLKEQING